MPKATVAGASIADEDGVCRTFEPLPVQHGGEEPPVAEGDSVEEEGGETPSAGNSSLESSPTPGQSSLTSDQPPRLTAPSAEQSSAPEQTPDSDAASPTTTSTTESGTTSPSDSASTTKAGSRKR